MSKNTHEVQNICNRSCVRINCTFWGCRKMVAHVRGRGGRAAAALLKNPHCPRHTKRLKATRSDNNITTNQAQLVNEVPSASSPAIEEGVSFDNGGDAIREEDGFDTQLTPDEHVTPQPSPESSTRRYSKRLRSACDRESLSEVSRNKRKKPTLHQKKINNQGKSSLEGLVKTLQDQVANLLDRVANLLDRVAYLESKIQQQVEWLYEKKVDPKIVDEFRKEFQN